jgi:hypothetical protein
MECPIAVIDLTHGSLMASRGSFKRVEVTVDGKYIASATRDPSPANVSQAEEQGYVGDAESVCWASVVDHELLHMTLAEIVLGGPSPTIQFEAGVPGAVPLYNRLYEESLVIALQRRINTGEMPWPLTTMKPDDLAAVTSRFAEYKTQLAAAWNGEAKEPTWKN